MNTHAGYSKKTLTDTNVLLAGGGDKSLADFLGGIQYVSTSHKIQYRAADTNTWTDLVTLVMTDENVKQTPKTDNINRPLMMINGGTSTGTLTSTSMFSTGIYANASTKMITAAGFIKTGSNNTYVLLGGGDHKLFGNADGNISVNNGTVCTNLNADMLDGYHASTVYQAANHKIHNGNTSNTWKRIATITISGTGLSIAGFTAIFSNRECLDNTSFILTLGIRRNNTTSAAGISFYYTALQGSVPRTITVRSDDNQTFYVYFQSAANSWTTYYNVTKIMTEGNITYENVGLTSIIDGTLTNKNALKGGNVNLADTAAKLATERTISLIGDAIGSTTFDGSADASISVSINDMIGATDSADGTAGFVPAPPSDGYNTKFLKADGTWTVPPNTTYSAGSLALYNEGTNTTKRVWSASVLKSIGNQYLPLAGGTMIGNIIMGTNYIYGVNESGGSMIHFDGNRTVIGSIGATSTLATHLRSITGHLTCGINSTASYTVWDSGNDGNGSGLDADLLDGLDSSEFPILSRKGTAFASGGTCDVTEVGTYYSTGSAISASLTNTPHTTSNFKLWHIITGHNSYPVQIAIAYKEEVYMRGNHNGTWRNWRKFAFIDSDITGNAATATALKNTHKLWGQDFNGTLDVSGNMTGVGTISASGNNTITKTSGDAIFAAVNNNGTIELHASTNRGVYDRTNTKWLIATNGTNSWLACGNVGIGITSPLYKLDVDGNVRATNFYTTSDRNKKENISEFSEHIRKFQLKNTEKLYYGVIAQEVEEIFRDGEEGNMTVNYNSVLSYYIGQLENRVKELEDKLKKYEEMLIKKD